MKVLYFSVLATPSAIEEAQKRNPQITGFAVQKFNRLITEGLSKNKVSVTAISSFYIPNVGGLYKRKKEWYNGVEYRYIKSPSNVFFRHIWLIIYSFFMVFFWGLIKRREKAIVCDVLNISVCLGSVTAARFLGLKRLGIVTDMPGLYINRRKQQGDEDNKRRLFNTKVNKSYLQYFTHYVFLTEQMNKVINTQNRPYLVMEGLVPEINSNPTNVEKEEKKIMLYAGGLHERYGLKLLVEGFIKADVHDSELWLYGDGPFVNDLKNYELKDNRIKYFGIRPNSEIMEAEYKATLLVNPRPTHEEFTQYSFPSKNMEYMASGTPVLTTRLPGMPMEYYPYVFLFDEESIEGYSKKIREVLSLSKKDLNKKGRDAQDWVLKTKNNVNQTCRIVNLIFG